MTESGPAPRPPVLVLVAFGIVGPMTIHLILPLLTDMQRQFGTSYATIQLLISLFVVAFGTAQLFVGPIADLAGRRNTLLAGLALYSLASAACAVAPNLAALIVFRIIQAVGACTGVVLARAIIRDHYSGPQATRILGYLAMGIAIGPMIGPAAGGALAVIVGWRGLFWALAALGAVNILVAYVHIRSAQHPRQGRDRFRRLAIDIAKLIRTPDFVLFTLNICFHTGVFYAFIVGGPFVGVEYLGLTPTVYGAWFGTAAIGYALGNFVAGRAIERWRPETAILIGAMATAVLAAWLLVVMVSGTRAPAAFFLPVAAMTFSQGLLMPNSYAGALNANPGLAGSASGLSGFSQFVFAALFSSAAGLALERLHHPVALAAVMVVAALLGLTTSILIAARAR